MIGELILSGYTYDQGRIAINDAFSGSASFNMFSANTMVSGSTNLYDIFLTTHDGNDITRVQGGTNITTGGTANEPTVNLDANIILTSVDATTISGGTLYSGGTELSTLFAPAGTVGDITRIQNGLNTYTGGTDNYPTVNISAATLSYLSATTINTKTITIGNHEFLLLSDAAIITWDFSLGRNAKVILGGNRELQITNTRSGDVGTLLVIQDGTGGRNISLTATTGTHKVINGGGGTVLLTSNAGSEDVLSFIRTSGTFYWNIGYNYS